MQKPLLSIGMIFKNEIRCLERCMKSLQPLREAISCELVMADTGSDDGSRAVAERYADILIDFPWINDFSAARNAVMDRCSGEWYLTVDADEWLDKDFSELITFLSHSEGYNYASLTVRNYKSAELELGGQYTDFFAGRLMRMSTGMRYTGRIHEHWETGRMTLLILKKVILHHDGYVYEDAEIAKEKAKRNLSAIKAELESNPEDLRLLMQYVESDSGETSEYVDYVYRAVKAVKEKKDGWQLFGPSIFRHAVMAATVKNLPELEEWISLAEEWFPESVFTRIDVQYFAMGDCWNKENYAECIRRGEAYLQGIADFRSGRYQEIDIVVSTLGMGSVFWEQSGKQFLAGAYLMENYPKKAIQVLADLDPTIMDGGQVKNYVRNLSHLYSWSQVNTEEMVLTAWNELNQPKPSKGKARDRRTAFASLSQELFHPVYRAQEQLNGKYQRPAYQFLLPLAGQCELGTAAAILETADRSELEKLLGMVEKWDEFPIYALEHALGKGAKFPVKPLNLETMDALASRMARLDGPLIELAIVVADGSLSDCQSLAWARGLALAAVKSCGWTDGEQGMTLCRAFAKIECAFLPRYYAADLLCEENIQVLPPMHRFGWYCAQAFQMLDAGDSAGYVRLLRKGLETCPEMKSMVEFLLKQLEESRKAQATPELLALAEQVRGLLAQYPADDPAVEALRQSAAYQKVAHLIEGPDLGVFGGLKQ